MEAAADASPPLRIVVFPWLAFGHMLPNLELAERLAKRGHRVSFVSTPRNISRLRPVEAGLIDFVALPFPRLEGLPDGCEATSDVPAGKLDLFYKAFDGLAGPFLAFLDAACGDDKAVDLLMVDSFHYWAAAATAEHKDAGGLMEISHNSDSTQDASGNGRSEQNGDENKVLGECETLLAPLIAITLREFKLSELKGATNGFLDSNIIGRGGIATVYKGVLNDGSVIAVKKFRWAPRLGWAHTYEQLLLTSKLQHKNIIKVLGYAHEHGPVMEWMKGRKPESEYIWVEEYAQKGTLHDIIHSQEHRFDWSSLIQIIEGIAQGLNYLHEQHIVHLDLKPTNIVLDANMSPKITDFEVAKVLNGN